MAAGRRPQIAKRRSRLRGRFQEINGEFRRRSPPGERCLIIHQTQGYSRHQVVAGCRSSWKGSRGRSALPFCGAQPSRFRAVADGESTQGPFPYGAPPRPRPAALRATYNGPLAAPLAYALEWYKEHTYDPEEELRLLPPGASRVPAKFYLGLAAALVVFTVVHTIVPEAIQLWSVAASGEALSAGSFTIQDVGTRILGVAMVPTAACLYALGLAASQQSMSRPTFRRLNLALCSAAAVLLLTANGILALFSPSALGLPPLDSAAESVLASPPVAWVLELATQGACVALCMGVAAAGYRGYRSLVSEGLPRAMVADFASVFQPRLQTLEAKLYTAAAGAWAFCVIIPSLAFDFVGAVKGSTLISQVAAGAMCQALGAILVIIIMALASLKEAAVARQLAAPSMMALNRGMIVFSAILAWLYVGPFGNTITIQSVGWGFILCSLTIAASVQGLRSARTEIATSN